MRAVLTLLLLASLAPSAQAGRPLVTEDAGVLDPGECEWESVAARIREGDGPAENAGSTQVGCGLGWLSQASIAVGQARSGGITSTNIGLGGKTRLSPEGEERFSLTLAYGVVWVHDEDRGVRPDLAAANLVLSVPLAQDWTGHANLGPTHYRDGQVTRATWALAVENDLDDGLGWGVESFGEHGSRPWLGAGLRWDVGPAWNLNLSYARQAGADAARMATLGVKFAF
jgi:hypothetical protein